MKKLWIMILAMAMVAVMTGCTAENTDSASGSYKIIAMADDENEYTKENMTALEELGLTVTLELKEDGTGLLNIYGQQAELTYDPQEMTITLDGQTISYTYARGILVMENNGTTMTFEKITDND